MKTDHWCAVFADRHEFLRHAVRFLHEGLEGNDRLLYVADRSESDAMVDLAPLGDVGSLVQTGRLAFASTGATYRADEPVDPLGQVAVYRAATDDAVAAGHRGLRVVADATPLVRTPAQLRQFVRYEHLVDHLMASAPFSAMCGYDRTRLPAATAAQLAAVHPHVAGHECAFNLYASSDAWAVLDGESDQSTSRLLGELCEAVWPEGRVDIDLRATRFIDHRSLLTLDRVAVARAGKVRLRNASSVVQQLVHLLDLRSTELVTS